MLGAKKIYPNTLLEVFMTVNRLVLGDFGVYLL